MECSVFRYRDGGVAAGVGAGVGEEMVGGRVVGWQLMPLGSTSQARQEREEKLAFLGAWCSVFRLFMHAWSSGHGHT